LDPEQEVGMAPPAAVEKRTLIDDLGAGGHGRDSGGLPGDQAGRTEVRTVKFDNLAALVAELLEVESLVPFATATDDVGVGGVRGWSGGPTTEGAVLEGGEARAGQVVGEVAGAEHDAAVEVFHSPHSADRVRHEREEVAAGPFATVTAMRDDHQVCLAMLRVPCWKRRRPRPRRRLSACLWSRR